MDDASRFWSHVAIAEGDACWIWTGGKTGRGYGAFVRADRRQVVASRFAYEDKVGPIPDGKNVLHHCDNPPCVRPDHLFAGTHLANMADMVAKGRSQSGDDHWTKRMPERIALGANAGGSKSLEKRRGSSNGRAKLTEDDVREIRGLVAAGGESLRSIGSRFGINAPHVLRIARRERWSHVV